ncbi:MAG: response regulator [Acidobacteria bacterium]|nr:response regulator [Acidobacteriota bacterium]
MSANPPHVLLIDDDESVLEMVGEALTHYGMKVHAFSDGERAIRLVQDAASTPLDLVISDINMEGMDGFDVIHRVKAIQADLPVVLMTGQASLDYAIRAMRMGAVNLFQKPLTMRELVKSVFHLVETHRDFRMAQAGLKGLVRETRHFSFRSDELDVPSVVKHLTDRLVPMGFATKNNLDVIAIAFHEALVNALEHGNLELDSSLKGDLLGEKDPYLETLEARLQDPLHGARKVDVFLESTPDRFEVSIRDEGPGFDTRIARQPADDNLTRSCGRGLPLIRLVLDEVRFNDQGNQIWMVLHKKGLEA